MKAVPSIHQITRQALGVSLALLISFPLHSLEGADPAPRASQQFTESLLHSELLSGHPNLQEAMQMYGVQADALHNFSGAFHYDTFNRELHPGTGVDIRNPEQSMFNAFSPQSFGDSSILKGTLECDYYHSSSEVVRSVGGGDKLSLSLATPKFAFGTDFKSSSMQKNEEQHSSGYLVIRFVPEYNYVGFNNPQLLPEARKYARDYGVRAFYARYGTHYIAEAQPQATYAVIYTFHADSQASLQSFEQDLGLHAGLPKILSVGFSHDVQQALSSKSRQVSFSFLEYYSTAAGLAKLPTSQPPPQTSTPPPSPSPAPSPAPASSPTPASGDAAGVTDPVLLMDPNTITDRYNAFIDKLLSGNIKAAYTEFKLRPFATILLPSKAPLINESNIGVALAVRSDLSNLLTDFQILIGAPDVFSYDGKAILTTKAIGDLANADQAISLSILNALSDPSEPNNNALTAAYVQASVLIDQFCNNPHLWPRESSIKFIVTPGTPPAATKYEVQLKCDQRLGKPTLELVSGQADATINSVTLLDLQRVGVAAHENGDPEGVTFVNFTTGKIDVKPVALHSVRAILFDGAHRVREAILFSSGDSATPVIPGDNWTEMY